MVPSSKAAYCPPWQKIRAVLVLRWMILPPGQQRRMSSISLPSGGIGLNGKESTVHSDRVNAPLQQHHAGSLQGQKNE